MKNHYCSLHYDDEDLAGVTDIGERRKIQNRRSQRKRRANMRSNQKTIGTINPIGPTSRTSSSASKSKTFTDNPTSWQEEGVRTVDQCPTGIDNLFRVIHGHGLTRSLDGLAPFLDSHKPDIWAQAENLSQQCHFMTDSWSELMFNTSSFSDVPALDSSTSTIRGSVSSNELQFSDEPVYNLEDHDLQSTQSVQESDRHDTDARAGSQRQARNTLERGFYSNINHSESRSKTADSSKILGKIQKLVDAIIDIYTLGWKTDMIHQDDELLALIKSIPCRIHINSDTSSEDEADIHADQSKPADANGLYTEAVFAE